MKVSLKKIVIPGVLLFSCFSQSADAMQRILSRTVGSRLSSSAHNMTLIPKPRSYSEEIRTVLDNTKFEVPVIEIEILLKVKVVVDEPVVKKDRSSVDPENEWNHCVSTQKNFASDNRQSEYDMQYKIGQYFLNQYLLKCKAKNNKDAILEHLIKVMILEDPICYKESVEIFMNSFNFLNQEELNFFYCYKCEPELLSITKEQFDETYSKQRVKLNEILNGQANIYGFYIQKKYEEKYEEYLNYSTY